MRELKFRAWCHEDKIMVYDLNSPRLVHGELKDNIYEFMQFTGLKDKNGKEIYEGDIILCSYEDISYKRIVSYDSDECCFGWNESGLTFSKQNESHFEIIGNIRENQDLIDKKY